MHTRTLFAAITILLLFISASLAIVLADGPLPGVDTAERDDVVVEDDGGGASGAVDEDDGARLPDVDTAERDDVVPGDDEGGASGAVDEDSGARLPDVDTAQRDDVVEEEVGASGAVDEDSEGRLPDVDTAERDDVVPEDDGGGASGAVDEGTEGRLPDVDNAQRDDVVPEDDEGATGRAANAPAPTGLTVTSDTDDSVSLSWNTVTDAGAYKVEYRRSGSISWLHAGYVYSSTSDTVDGLDCNTSYYFQVRARGDGSPYSYTYGNPSSSVSETTDACVAPAPTGLRVTSDTDDSVSLSWNAVTDAHYYKVEYRRSSSSSWLHASYTFGTSRTVSGLDPNTAYDFQVRARGDGSPYSYTYGSPSTSVSRTTDPPTAPAPTGLRATASTETSVSLSWNAVTDAHYYKVEYRRSSSSSWLHAGYTFGTSRTVSGLDPNTPYDFQVRARGDGSPYSYTYGSPSTSVSRTTDPPTAPAPTGLRATASTETSVSLSWNAVTDAHYYKVEYRRSSSSSWLHAGYTFGTSRTVSGLDPNTAYDFQVRARGDGSPYSYTYGSPSTSVSRTTDPPTAPAPTGLRATASTETSVSLSWNDVTDAGAYKVEYRRSSSISWLHAGYVYSSTSDTVDGLDCNTSYDFQVRARGDGSPYSTTYGDASSSVSRRTTECPVAPAPTNLSATASGQSTVTLRWNPVADAQYYKLERSTSRTGTWTDISETIGGTSRTVYGLECNTLYYFKVSARGDGHPYSTTFGQQSSGDVSRRTTECPTAPAPIGLEVVASTDTTIDLEWFWVRDAEHYKLERSLDGSTGWTLADAGADSITSGVYRVTGLACNTTYYFRVSARGDGHPYSTSFGTPSPNSGARITSPCTTAAPAPAPTGLMATASTETSVSLSWNPVTDAYRYRLEHSESSSGPWTAETETSSASDTVGGLNCNTTYYFRVRARGDGSPYSTTFGAASGDVSETTSTCPNRPPAFNTASYSFSVNEDAANGIRVGTVSAIDPDTGDAVSYSITPVSAKFAIGSTSGVITVADVLDHETQSSYVLTLEANDSNGGRGTATVSIAVTDVNEVSISGPGNVVEGGDMTFTVTSEQGGVTATYTIGGTATRGIDYADPGTGPLTVTVPAGQTTQSIVIDTTSDTTTEVFESVTITLASVVVGSVVIDSANSSATAKISDLISVSSIDDDGESPEIIIDTSEPMSTIWIKLAGDGGLLDFDHYNNRAYVIKVEAEAQPTGSGNWKPGKIVSAKTGQHYQDDLPRYGDLGGGQASWVEGDNAPAHRYVLLNVERPSTVPNLSRYRITLSKPDYTLIEPEWNLPAPGDTTGTLNVRIKVRNNSDRDSADRNDDMVKFTCKAVGGREASRSYSFTLLREGRNHFLDGESDQLLDLGTICQGMTLTQRDRIASLTVGLYLSNSVDPIQEASYKPDPVPAWPFAVTDTLGHKQSAVTSGGVVVGDMMGGLQLYMMVPGDDSWCTSSFGLELTANSAAKRATHGSSPFQAMSTTAHCQDIGGTWHQGAANNRPLYAEELGNTLWMPPRPVPSATSCEIAVNVNTFAEQESCLRGDQAYSDVTAPPPGATWTYENTRIYKPDTQSPNTIAALAKPLIEYFKNNAARGRFTIMGARPPQPMDTVHKVGRTTGWTSGRITNFGRNGDSTCPGSPLGINDHGPWKNNYFVECVVQAEYKSRGGDSGSPVFVWADPSNPGTEVLLVGVHFAGTDITGTGRFIPIDRIYAESLREGYDWSTEEIRPIPVLRNQPTVSGSTLRATFEEVDFSRGPNLYYVASLFRRQAGGSLTQVTNAAGNNFGQEVKWDGRLVEFNVSRIPLNQRSGDFSIRVVMCPQDVETAHTLDYCSSYGPEGSTVTLPLLAPPPPQGLTATGDTNGRARLQWTNVPSASSYRFQYREFSSDNSNGWTDVTGTASPSPAYVTNLDCKTYDFRVSSQGDGTNYSGNWSEWSEFDSATVTTCTVGSRSGRDVGQGVDKPTVVAIPESSPVAPQNLTGETTHDSVTLTWEGPGDSTVTGYQVLRKRFGEADLAVHVEDTGSSDTSYTDTTDLEPDTTYVYRVRAISDAGVGGSSDFVRLRTQRDLSDT